MSDLVEELRERAVLIMPDNPSGLLDSAANEIERLLGIIAARDEWACKAHERIEVHS